MLMRTDPLREFDRLAAQLLASRESPWMSIDAFRDEGVVTVEIDLPGIDPSTIDLTVERNELRIEAERFRHLPESAQYFIRERPQGTYSRRLFVGDNLDTDRIEAEYTNGVLVVRIPVAESAKPRRVEVRQADTQAAITV